MDFYTEILQDNDFHDVLLYNTPGTEDTKHFTFRNGVQTNIQNYNKPNNPNESKAAMKNRRKNAVSRSRGLHESWDWYNKCYIRERNKGLINLPNLSCTTM